MPHTYCVWYRVKDADDREVETVIRTLQARLGCRTGIVGRLLKKRDSPHTWMELYEGVDDVAAFEQHLQALTDQFDVDMFMADSRHVECFIDEDARTTRPRCTKGK